MIYNNHTYTSLYIQKPLLEKAKEKAKADGISFSKLVEQALQSKIKSVGAEQ